MRLLDFYQVRCGNLLGSHAPKRCYRPAALDVSSCVTALNSGNPTVFRNSNRKLAET